MRDSLHDVEGIARHRRLSAAGAAQRQSGGRQLSRVLCATRSGRFPELARQAHIDESLDAGARRASLLGVASDASFPAISGDGKHICRR